MIGCKNHNQRITWAALFWSLTSFPSR